MENNYKNLLKAEKLEQLLVSHWTQFLESSKLIAFVNKTIQDNIKSFASINCLEIKKSNSITLSRFETTNKGFLIWAEFNVPLANERLAEGAIEFYLSFDGSIISISNVIGNIYIKN